MKKNLFKKIYHSKRRAEVFEIWIQSLSPSLPPLCLPSLSLCLPLSLQVPEVETAPDSYSQEEASMASSWRATLPKEDGSQRLSPYLFICCWS